MMSLARPVFLWTDMVLFALVALALAYAWHARRTPALRHSWQHVGRHTSAMCAAVVLALFVGIGLLDSLHYAPTTGEATVQSVLDRVLAPTIIERVERSYSAPLASREFLKRTHIVDDAPVRDFPRLQQGFGASTLPDADRISRIVHLSVIGLMWGAVVSILLALVWACLLRRRYGGVMAALRLGWRDTGQIPWRPMWVTATLLSLLVGTALSLSTQFHVLGTDQAGNDVLFNAVKSVRTALVIGSLTTAAMLPPALLCGLASGYFRGWVDDLIQYIYTTLTSIPGVLLVAACVLMMQVYIDNHAAWFPTAAARADLRLLLLCLVLGLTGWAGLCRLIRAETMKLREQEYVLAARAFGLSSLRILRRHVLPNVTHIVLVTLVLEFSGLVLYEAVLSYLGIGVDPTMHSFGTMIDASRTEMSRDPVIWWSLFAAFVFLLALVLAANIFSDAVREAFDPRTRSLRRRLAMAAAGRRRQAEPGASAQTPAREMLEVSQLELRAVHASESNAALLVNQLALRVAAGCTLALVGESGSGKSLTALALMRLLPPGVQLHTGSAQLEQVSLFDLPEFAMRGVRGGRIGIIFQEPSSSLNPVMRVGEQITEVLHGHTPLRGRQARARAVQWLERVGIADAAHRIDDYPFQFSGGQKQRIMIAMALAAEPVLLIADEPTTALDATVRRQILDLLADIQREQGIAIILITHDLTLAKHVADHVALMRHGRVLAYAPADEFFAQAPHPYARQLFDAVPSWHKRGRPLSGRPAAAVETDAAIEGYPSDSPLLVVHDLSVKYRHHARQGRGRGMWRSVLQSVDLRVDRGETLALLGESGCGKTTLGRTLAGLVEGAAVAGEASLENLSLVGSRGFDARARRRLQLVFQDPHGALDPRMPVGDILDEGLRALRSDLDAVERQRRVSRLLDQVGLPAQSVHRYPHEFSGGQRQRIAIARALAVEPHLLICDEPTSALDVSVQAQILDLLRDIQAQTGLSYLFITHDVAVVAYLADRVAVMDQGRIVEQGSTRAVLHTPQHPLTQRLLQASPGWDE